MDPHTIQVWMGALGIFGGCMAAVWGFAWSMHKTIEQKVHEREAKFSTVFRRMDECKDEIERKYQPREVCTILHQSLQEKVRHIEGDLHEIKTDMKKIIKFINGKASNGD